MGVKDIGTPARTLGRNAPVFQELVVIEVLDPFKSIDIPLRISEFTEAFELVITCRGNPDQLNPSSLLFLVNGQGIGQAVIAESLGIGETYRQIIPAWRDKVNITGHGVNSLDFVTRVQVTFTAVVYQLDRVTRDEYLGSG